jgi:hypothetical protein
MRFGGKMGCGGWDCSDISRFSAGIVAIYEYEIEKS